MDREKEEILNKLIALHKKVVEIQKERTQAPQKKASPPDQTKILQSLLNQLHDAVIAVDQEGEFLFWNPAAVELMDLNSSHISPEKWSEHFGLFLPDKVTPCPENSLPMAQAMRCQAVDELELFLKNSKKPQGVWLSAQVRLIQDENGTPSGGLCILRDITERKQSYERLIELASFPELSPYPIIEVDLSGQIHYLNPKAARSIPDIYDEGFNHPFLAGLESIVRIFETEGKDFHVREVQVGGVHYEQVLHYVKETQRIRIYTHDVTDLKQARLALAEQSIRDPLTHLYNRHYFNYRVQEEIARANRNQNALAVLMCDIDHFKEINERRGHDVGDAMLKAVAKGVQESIRGADLVFRWGGDEVVVVLSDTTRDGVLIAADRMRNGILKAIHQTGISLEVSIGAALYPEHGVNSIELIRQAELALAIAKKSGNKIHVGAKEYLVDENTVKIVFQPIVNIRTQEPIGYESLGRDPQGKLGILDLFKKYQAIGQLNELKRICFGVQLKEAQRAGIKKVFINMDFTLLNQLKAVPKPADLEVILEISEREAIHNIENHLEIASQWRALGYKFAIDDFGAGFISLPFIARLIPEYIKIDRSTLLHAVSSDPFKEFMVGMVFGLQNYSTEGIIVEGVESSHELQVAKDMGVYLIQGYLFGRPQEMPDRPSS